MHDRQLIAQRLLHFGSGGVISRDVPVKCLLFPHMDRDAVPRFFLAPGVYGV